MDYERLFSVADAARTKGKLSAGDTAFVKTKIPKDLADYPKWKRPTKINHPAGFSVSGAPVGTFIRSALLMAGRKALGDRYGGSPFYEQVEKDVSFGIMRSHFHNDYPKGAFCCSQCTLAVYPLLEAGALRYFDNKALAKNVRRMIDEGSWRFASAPNAKMLDWSLGH
jgi:hypothetical protein